MLPRNMSIVSPDYHRYRGVGVITPLTFQTWALHVLLLNAQPMQLKFRPLFLLRGWNWVRGVVCRSLAACRPLVNPTLSLSDQSRQLDGCVYAGTMSISCQILLRLRIRALGLCIDDERRVLVDKGLHGGVAMVLRSVPSKKFTGMLRENFPRNGCLRLRRIRLTVGSL